MKKKKVKKIRTTMVFADNERALRELTTMKHRDLQRACIVRGIPHADVANFDHHKLVSWFIKNYDVGQNENLLIEYDAWVDQELRAKGYKDGDILLSPALKYSYIGNLEKMDKPKLIKPSNSKIPPPIVKKEVSKVNVETGIRSGTKKALTYDLTIKDVKIDEIIKLVIQNFPEAQEKSIRIWNKRCINAQKNKIAGT